MWHRRKTATCQLCGEPATHSTSDRVWPGTRRATPGHACDTHASYLDGVGWFKQHDRDWETWEERKARA